MQLYIEDKLMDLGKDFQLEIQRSSPIWSDGAAVTIPATIPMTPANALALGFPGRLDAGSDIRRVRDGVLIDGCRRREVKVNITESSDEEGVALTLAWCNSAAYAELSNRKLTDLRCLPVRLFANMYTLQTTLSTAGADNEDKWFEDVVAFPICVAKEDYTTDDERTVTFYEVLNDPHAFYNATYRKAVIDGKEVTITVPEGYGIAPMIKAWRVLDFIFEEAGLELENNPLKDDPALRRLTVLNNVADACAGSPRVNYADLMPDATVEEFLHALWVRLGLVWDVNLDTGKVRMRLLRDILDDTQTIDLSPYRLRPGRITYNTPQYVKLTSGQSIEGAKPAADTWSEFIGKRALSAPKVLQSNTTVPSTTNFVFTIENDGWQIWDRENSRQVTASNSNFNYDPAPAGLEPYDLAGVDEVVDIGKATIAYPGLNYNDDTPMFLVGAANLHTEIKNYSSEKAEEAKRAPLAFLYCLNNKGVKHLPLTPESTQLGDRDFPAWYFDFKGGLFDNFWRRMDEILRYGNRQFEVSCRMPRTLIDNLDIFQPVMYEGIKCLIESMSYTLPDANMVTADITLRTIDTQGSYDIDSVQALPSLDDGSRNLYWTYNGDNFKAVAQSDRVFRTALQLCEEQTGYTQGFIRSHIQSVSMACIYEADRWRRDPQNENATYPGDTVTRKYTGTVSFLFVLKIGDDTLEVEVDVEDVEYSVYLYCVYEGTPQLVPYPDLGDYTDYEWDDGYDFRDDDFPDPDDRDPFDDDRDDYPDY